MSAPREKIAESSDGRRLRSVRSRKNIVDALIALVNAGTLVPTAQQIADQAGVGIRTVFRHFSDMESMFAAADAQKRRSYEELFAGGNREGSIHERLQCAIEHRARAYETTKNEIVSTHAQRWRYEFLRKNYAGYVRGLKKDLEDWLPELKSLDKHTREAIDAQASFEMWHRLREYQGLSKKMSIEVIVNMISAQLDDY